VSVLEAKKGNGFVWLSEQNFAILWDLEGCVGTRDKVKKALIPYHVGERAWEEKWGFISGGAERILQCAVMSPGNMDSGKECPSDWETSWGSGRRYQVCEGEIKGDYRKGKGIHAVSTIRGWKEYSAGGELHVGGGLALRSKI